MKSITNTVGSPYCGTAVQPPLPQSWAGHRSLRFYGILIIFFFVYPLDKTKFLSFLVHCSMINTFRVIPNNVRKLLILNRFWHFLSQWKHAKQYHSQLFLVSISKKGIKHDIWKFNILKNQFPGTLRAILYKINLTDFWGQLNLHIYITVEDF